jgi:hypothetical protein
MIQSIIDNWAGIAEAIAAIIGCASIVVRLTPTLKDDAILLPVVKFVGKFIALNTNAPAVRPK